MGIVPAWGGGRGSRISKFPMSFSFPLKVSSESVFLMPSDF